MKPKSTGLYYLDYLFDLGDLGHHSGMIRGCVEVNEYGNSQVRIEHAVVYPDTSGPLDVTKLLTRSAKVDIEEKLADKHQARMGHREPA